MKFVTLIVAMIVSLSAAAQTTRRATEKSTAHGQQKTSGRKAKLSRAKASAAATDEVITLTDEKAHKAKWTFEEMLKRRLQIDAEEGAALQQKE